MGRQIAILLFLLLIAGCDKVDNGFTSSGPVSSYLIGKWELTKIENTKTGKISNQLRYREILEIGNDNSEDYNKVYRDEVLINIYIRARSRGIEMSVKEMTVLDRFRDNKERFYRIINGNAQGISLEASDYIEKVGSNADTLKYYYALKK